MKHSDLVSCASRFLRSIRCAVYLTECGHHERPDAIGWMRDGSSVVIECKRTRKDFLAEFSREDRKIHRRELAMGSRRYFLSRPGVIGLLDLRLPEWSMPWGLIHVYNSRRLIVIKEALAFPVRNTESETRLLVTALGSRLKRERPQVLQLDLFDGAK